MFKYAQHTLPLCGPAGVFAFPYSPSRIFDLRGPVLPLSAKEKDELRRWTEEQQTLQATRREREKNEERRNGLPTLGDVLTKKVEYVIEKVAKNPSEAREQAARREREWARGWEQLNNPGTAICVRFNEFARLLAAGRR